MQSTSVRQPVSTSLAGFVLYGVAMKTIVACFTVAFTITLAVIYNSVDNISLRIAAVLDAFGLFLRILALIIIVALVLFTVVILYALWTKYAIRSRRLVDGAFPLQTYRVRQWNPDIPWPLAFIQYMAGQRLLVNPNTMMASAAVVDSQRGLVEQEPAAGWQYQLALRLAVEHTNRVRAAFPGDQVHMSRREPTRTPRLNGSTMRALSYEKPPQPQLPVPIDVETRTFPAKPPAFAEAVRSNCSEAFALGHTPNGEIVRWDVTHAPHLRVHGKSQGSGKTNLIKTIAVGAITQGAHVIVLDRRAFKDWADFRRHVEFVDNRREGAFVGTLRQLQALYMERDERLGVAGSGNVRGMSIQRILVVISEFGSVCRSIAAAGELDEALPVLKSIMSESGATGVHLIFEDQVVNRNWPRELRGNADPVTGYLPEDAAVAGGYRMAHTLKPYEFHFDGSRMRTWDMTVEVPRVLAGVQPCSETMIDVRSFVPVPTQNNNEHAPNPVHSGGGNGNGNNERQNKWEDFARQWLANNPDGGPSALARAMWEADGRIKEYTDYKSEAARRLAALRSATAADQLAALGVDLADVRLPGGECIGVDVTH